MPGDRLLPAPPVILHVVPSLAAAPARPKRGALGLERRLVTTEAGIHASLGSVLGACVREGRSDLVVNLVDAGPSLDPEVVAALAQARERPWEGGRLQVCGVRREHAPDLTLHRLDRGISFHATERAAAEAAFEAFEARRIRAESLAGVEVRLHDLSLSADAVPKKMLKGLCAWDPPREAAVLRVEMEAVGLLAECVTLLFGSGIDSVIVDVTDLAALPGPALGALLGARQAVEQNRGFFAVFGAATEVLASLYALGATKDLPLFPSREAAVDAFRQRLVGVPVRAVAPGAAPATAAGDLRVERLAGGEVFLRRAGSREPEPAAPEGAIYVLPVALPVEAGAPLPLPPDADAPLVLQVAAEDRPVEEVTTGAAALARILGARPGPSALWVADRRAAMLFRLAAERRPGGEGTPIPVATDLPGAIQDALRRLPREGKPVLRLRVIRLATQVGASRLESQFVDGDPSTGLGRGPSA